MSLKNTKTAEIYKDAYITVYDKYDEPIKSFDSIDSLLQMFTDIDLTQRIKDETIR